MQVLAKGFTDYLSAHWWAVDKATKAHILLKSGTSMEIARNNPHLEVLVFRFRCEGRTSSSRALRNPGNTFKLIEHGFFSLHDYLSMGVVQFHKYIEILNTVKTMHEQQLARNNPKYVGTLPAFCTIDDTTYQTVRITTVHRPPMNFVITDYVRTAVADIVRLCVNSMKGDLPLRVADARLPFHPVPGQFVRSNGRWNWEPLFIYWDNYQAGRESCGPLAMLEDIFSSFWKIGSRNEAGGA